jgi:hypothetical protein
MDTDIDGRHTKTPQRVTFARPFQGNTHPLVRQRDVETDRLALVRIIGEPVRIMAALPRGWTDYGLSQRL